MELLKSRQLQYRIRKKVEWNEKGHYIQRIQMNVELGKYRSIQLYFLACLNFEMNSKQCLNKIKDFLSIGHS